MLAEKKRFLIITLIIFLCLIGYSAAFVNSETGVGHPADEIGPGAMTGPISVSGNLMVEGDLDVTGNFPSAGVPSGMYVYEMPTKTGVACSDCTRATLSYCQGHIALATSRPKCRYYSDCIQINRPCPSGYESCGSRRDGSQTIYYCGIKETRSGTKIGEVLMQPV